MRKALFNHPRKPAQELFIDFPESISTCRQKHVGTVTQLQALGLISIVLAWNAPQRFELLELRLLGPETLEWAQDANRWLPNRLTKYWNRPSRKFPWSFSESEKRFTLDANIMDNDRLEWTAGLITKRIQTSEPPLDIILGSFDSQPNDLSYIRLLTISLNKASGMLILTSHLPNKLKLLDNGKWIPMHPESGRAIYSRDRNLFSAFTLFQYKLSFCSVDSLSTQDMDIVRDTLFQPEDAALMKRASTFPPSPMLVRVGNILICQPLYQRELDMRSHGIDLDGGNFVLVKETVVRTESEREMIVDEGKLGQELEVCLVNHSSHQHLSNYSRTLNA